MMPRITTMCTIFLFLFFKAMYLIPFHTSQFNKEAHALYYQLRHQEANWLGCFMKWFDFDLQERLHRLICAGKELYLMAFALAPQHSPEASFGLQPHY